jgi:ABC-type phosphate transport system substrate-binding protein
LRNVCAAVFVILALATTASPARGEEFLVVVNPSVRGTWISRAALKALFTRSAERWGGDKAEAKPVDQSASSPVRHAFTVAVIGLSMGEVQRYWQNRVVANRVLPPPVKANDDDVLLYVASTSGAVGYVAPGTPIPAGVKVISIVE